MKIIQSLLFFLGFMVSASLLLAQDSRMQRLEQGPGPGGGMTNLQMGTSGLSGQAGRQGEDFEDLGPELILARRSKPKIFEFSADTQYSFNSNILLTPRGAISDGELFETLALSASPRLIPNLTSTVYLNQQFVRYNHTSNRQYEFDGQTAGVSFGHPVGNWFNLTAGYLARRYCSPWDAMELSKEYDTSFGLWRSQGLGKYASIYYGYQLEWIPTNPSQQTRIYNQVYGGVNVPVTERFLAQLYYRLRHQDYLQSARNDLDHLVSLTFTYTWNQFIATRIYGSYADNSSNQAETYSYRAASGGGGLALSLKF